MLVLSRKRQESVVIGGSIIVTVLECSDSRVRLGITAPADLKIVRQELLTDQANSLRPKAVVPATGEVTP